MNTPSSPPLEEIKGTVDRIRHRREHSDWAVITVELDGSRSGNSRVVTAVGELGWAYPGERIHIRGVWKWHSTFGKQFEARETRTEDPTSLEGIEKYLSHSKASGIGPTMARRLVDKFGPDVLDVIDNHPERLREVEGIGKKRAENIANTWQARKEDRKVELFLHSHAITRAYFPRIKKAYGDQVIARVTHNPYNLAVDIRGFGFKMADRVARTFKIIGDDPRRVRAGILYVLTESSSEGHLYLPLEELLERAAAYLNVGKDHISAGIETLHHEGHLIHEPVPEQPDTPGHLAVYHKKAWEAETGCAEHLRRLADASEPLLPARTAMIVDEVQGNLGFQLAPAQEDAIRGAFTHQLLVITGGPGTGKTTLVQAICQIATKLDWSLKLAAPTGRAARRMSEATGHEATTLHRLLEFSFQAGGFQKNTDEPLQCDLLVVDEASMIDIQLMKALVHAVPSSCRLVLVGDVDQLPSVGPGDILADLIRSRVIAVCRLDTVFRQSEQSAIVRNAHRINQGLSPENIAPKKGELLDFYVLKCADAEGIFDKTLKVVTERISQAFGFDPVRDVQVIAPMHKGPVGCRAFNEALQEALNDDDGPEATFGYRTFRRGDRVMQLRNNYDKEVFNGDVGYVFRVLTDHEGKVEGIDVEMDGRSVTYQQDELDDLTLAYAVTAHKSQGSEYPAVIIPLATSHYVMLERNLLYTAITRARKLVVLVTMDAALNRAVKNVSARARFTRLAARLGNPNLPRLA